MRIVVDHDLHLIILTNCYNIYIYTYVYIYYSYNFKAAILIKPMLMHTKEASYSMFVGISNIFVAVLLLLK